MKMTKLEKVLWIVGLVLVTVGDFIVLNAKALEFLKAPSWIFSAATLASLLVRNIYLRVKSGVATGELPPEPKKDEEKKDEPKNQ